MEVSLRKTSAPNCTQFSTTSVVVPVFVLVFLAKGGKYVPDGSSCSSKGIVDALPCLRRQIFLHKHFPRDTDTSTEFKRSKAQSSWETIADARVDSFMNLVRHDLLNYRDRPFALTLSYFDKCALSWIKDHSRTIMVIDNDKSLRECLRLRVGGSQIFQLALPIMPQGHRSRVRDTKCSVDSPGCSAPSPGAHHKESG